MPTFKLNKLIRDGFRQIYADIGQIAVYEKITPNRHKELLIEKIIEEVKEVPVNGTTAEITNEIADVQQALDDLMTVCGVTAEQVETAQQKIFAEKGGFSQGTYVTSLILKDNDKWVEYYRKEPDRFPESK